LPPIDIHIVHTDNSPTQYKCRQNFLNVAEWASHQEYRGRLLHKFGQKYRFKGSWDATGKHVKQRILNNELKNLRCKNAWYCYTNLRVQMSKNGKEELISKLEEHEKNGDMNVLKNTTFTTKRTFIGYATKDRSENDSLVEHTNYDHLVYTDRSETNKRDMLPLDKTQMLEQVHGKCTVNLITKKWQLTSSILPCACPTCRIKPSDYQNCLYKDDRKSTKIDIKMRGESINENPDDIYGYMVLTVAELKTKLNGRGIATPKRLKKRESVALLTQAVEDEYANDDDGDEVVDDSDV
jgi:hypothetical protein